MSYEDMCHEQENQTCFEIEDQMSALPIWLRINDSDEEYWGDCIQIRHHDDPPVMIGPRDALDILKWLQYHQKRIEAVCERQLLLES